MNASPMQSHRLIQPGKPRKSEGWEKIYVAAFGTGALNLPLVIFPQQNFEFLQLP
jgi:hypothetical protein